MKMFWQQEIIKEKYTKSDKNDSPRLDRTILLNVILKKLKGKTITIPQKHNGENYFEIRIQFDEVNKQYSANLKKNGVLLTQNKPAVIKVGPHTSFRSEKNEMMSDDLTEDFKLFFILLWCCDDINIPDRDRKYNDMCLDIDKIDASAQDGNTIFREIDTIIDKNLDSKIREYLGKKVEDRTQRFFLVAANTKGLKEKDPDNNTFGFIPDEDNSHGQTTFRNIIKCEALKYDEEGVLYVAG